MPSRAVHLIAVMSLFLPVLPGQRKSTAIARNPFSSSIALRLDGPSDVFVDGEKVATVTSAGIRKVSISPGDHFLEVRSSGRVWEKRVTVPAGTQIAEEVRLACGTVAQAEADGLDKYELERAIAGLRTMRGDLGIQSLIATNTRELVALKALGERRYLEFELIKGDSQRSAYGIGLALKGTDLGRCTFELEVTAEGETIEKQNKKINEPIQLLISTSAQPYELVINEITRRSIAGYLAVPRGAKNGSSTNDLAPVSAPTRLEYSNSSGDSISAQIAKIEQGQHLALPPPTAAPLGLEAPGGSVQRTLKNQTAYTLTVLLTGPVDRQLTIAAGRTMQLALPPGTYRVAARISAPNVLPFFGVQSYSPGQAYQSHFYIQ